MRGRLLSILFWGALWGFAEATLGYALHFTAIALPGLPGFVMFPVAFFFCDRAVSATDRPYAAFGAALVAAALKLLDFILPGLAPVRIVNPALSILLEGLAVFVVLAALRHAGRRVGPVPALAMGVLWRSLFLVYLGFIFWFGWPAGLATSGILVALRFLLLESLINAALILLLSSVPHRGRRPERPWAQRPALVFGLLAVSVAVQLVV